MRGRARSVAGFLTALGAATVLIGLATLLTGVVAPDRVRDSLGNLAIDAPAVGGAMAALGLAVAAMGLAQLAVARGLVAASAWAWTAGIVLCSTLTAAFVAAAVAGLVAATRNAGFALTGVGLALVAVSYGTCVVGLIGLRRRPERSSEPPSEA